MPAVRRKFNTELLTASALRDGATVLLPEEPFNSKENLNFTCACGGKGCRRMDVCVNFGFFCAPCSAIAKISRQAENMKLSRNLEPTGLYQLITARDDNVDILTQDHEIALALAPNMRGVYTNTNKTYVTVTWWDMQTHRSRQKSFKNDQKLDLQQVDKFKSTLKAVPDSYRHFVIMKDLVKDVRFYTRNFRLALPVIEYGAQPVLLDPYIMSSWLGDGVAKKPWICGTDDAMLETWRQWASDNDCNFVQNQCHNREEHQLLTYSVSRRPIPGQNRSNPLTDILRNLGIYEQKRIPDVYKKNTIGVRMEVLAGLIDTDGHIHNGTAYEFVQSLAHEQIFDDLREIVISLGFRMTKKSCMKTCTYKGVKKEFPAIRGIIYGDQRLSEIPLKIAYKKMVKERLSRHDLYTFDVKPHIVDSQERAGSHSID